MTAAAGLTPAPTALFAGGGTAGHVFPALAVADELLGRGWEVRFAGSATGPEARLVGGRGLPFDALPARPFVGKGPWAKARALVAVGGGALAAARLVRRRGVRVVVGTGGYVSAPAVLGARLARRPALLVELNAGAGTANRWLSRWATEAALGYAPAAAGLACPSTVTGVPVRRAFFATPEPVPGGPRRLLILGGSQGSRQLNLELPAALAGLAGTGPLAVVHQAGAGKVDEATAAWNAAGLAGRDGLAVEVVPFVDDVAGAMAAAELVVSRAGAMTTAELCAAGRAALLVPLDLAGGHQVDNARLLAAAGAARMVTSAELIADPAALAKALGELLADRGRLAAMGRAARVLANPRSAAAIADRVELLSAGDFGRAAA